MAISAYLWLYFTHRSMGPYHCSSTVLVSFSIPHIFIDKVWNELIVLIGKS